MENPAIALFCLSFGFRQTRFRQKLSISELERSSKLVQPVANKGSYGKR